MKYNFDEVIDRRQTRSVKWGAHPNDVLPLWVADMDFRVAPQITAAMTAALAQGLYGYDLRSDDVKATLCERLDRLYAWKVEPQHVVFMPGVVSAFSVAARAFVPAGQGMLVQPPVYYPMLQVEKWQGIRTDMAPLQVEKSGSELHYFADIDKLESAIKGDTRLFLLCSPHNPTGVIWGRDALRQFAELCVKHDLIMCSDEIHAELTLAGARHVPLAVAAPDIASRTITLFAPSKTFNMPGLGCAFAIIPDERTRARFEQAKGGLVTEPMGPVLDAANAALSAATDDWLDEVRAYLTANRDTLIDFIRAELPRARSTVPDATYLAWLDFSEYDLPSSPGAFFLEHARVALNDGPPFGPGGAGFARLNFGCPRSVMLEALEKMRDALRSR